MIEIESFFSSTCVHEVPVQPSTYFSGTDVQMLKCSIGILKSRVEVKVQVSKGLEVEK